MANVPKAQIKAKLATLLKSKEEQIAIFGLKTKFGGGRTTGFAAIYDSVDLRKKYDSKKMLRRVSTLRLYLIRMIASWGYSAH
jgi:small subunit ribosomal protein S24e